MSKFFILEPVGQRSYALFDTMVEPFRARGHEFVNDAADADVVFFDLWTGLGVFNKHDVEKALFWQKPVIAFDSFDYWGSPEFRPNFWSFDDCKILRQKVDEYVPWAVRLNQFMRAGLLKVCFVRKMSKSWLDQYPSWCRPFECAIWPDHDFEPVSKNEYKDREFDTCFIGNATPWRANAAVGLKTHGLLADFFFPFHRIEHQAWLSRHRNACTFLEADGGGFGSERPYQLGLISAMLKAKNDQHMAFPWTHGVNCIEFGNQWGEMASHDEGCSLRKLFGDFDFLYQIYEGGVAHLKAHYTNEARAEYILSEMHKEGLC